MEFELAGKLDSIVQALSVFSTMAISLTAIVTFLSLVFKPVRKFVVLVYKKVVGTKDKGAEIIKKIDEVTSALSTKIDSFKVELEEKIRDVSDSNDRNEKNRIRWEILNFANSCKKEERHTQDDYKHIIELHDQYEELLKKMKEKNGFLDIEYDYILKHYAEVQEKNDFLFM